MFLALETFKQKTFRPELVMVKVQSVDSKVLHIRTKQKLCSS